MKVFLDLTNIQNTVISDTHNYHFIICCLLLKYVFPKCDTMLNIHHLQLNKLVHNGAYILVKVDFSCNFFPFEGC